MELLAVLLVAGIGAYIGSYLREKAKNLATREDLDPLIRGQETIKQQLAHFTFIEGRRWELQREVIWELQKELAEVLTAAIELNALSRSQGDADRRQVQLDRLLDATMRMTASRAIAGSLIDSPLAEELDAAVREACRGLPHDNWISQEEFKAYADRIQTGIVRLQAITRSVLFNEPLQNPAITHEEP